MFKHGVKGSWFNSVQYGNIFLEDTSLRAITKKTLFLMSPVFENTRHKIPLSIRMLDWIHRQSDCTFDWPYIGPTFGLLFYCFHFWAGAPKSQREPFDCAQRRTVRIVWNQIICEKLRLCIEKFPRCVFSTAFIMGSVLGNCLICCDFVQPHSTTPALISSTLSGYVELHCYAVS